VADPKYVTRPIAYAVFLEGGDAFDESAITVSLMDEGAGCFVVVRSTAESETTNGQIAMDFAALSAVQAAAKMLEDANHDQP